MAVNPELVAPCGLYCGVCAILIADRDNNEKFKERLVGLYQGGDPAKGALPGAEVLTTADIKCSGCRSAAPFVYCRQCKIKDCTGERGYEGCHQCDEFPCAHIENFPMAVGKAVILRSIPHWREKGTEQYVADEIARHTCPSCGNLLFRGASRCNKCKAAVVTDLPA
ncbi:MAG: DUF3795 domain-containing protein [Deltaproteobacteria bacterium]|nr:DUF3795 domain-containing protein [Deltaproteobacteria bacterium]